MKHKAAPDHENGIALALAGAEYMSVMLDAMLEMKYNAKTTKQAVEALAYGVALAYQDVVVRLVEKWRAHGLTLDPEYLRRLAAAYDREAHAWAQIPRFHQRQHRAIIQADKARARLHALANPDDALAPATYTNVSVTYTVGAKP